MWEALFPVPAISSQDMNDQTNRGYRRNTFLLLEEEVTFKKCIGGGGRKALPEQRKAFQKRAHYQIWMKSRKTTWWV